MEGRMTAAELIDALRAARVTPEEGEGVTVQELVEASRGTLSDEAARKLLRPLIKAGTVRPSRKRMLAMDGYHRVVPSYVLVEVAAPVKRGRAKVA
jgi:hypothetical protein